MVRGGPSGGSRSRGLAIAAGLGRGALRYGMVLVVFLATAAVLRLRILHGVAGTPQLLLSLAVLICAWAGGLGPGLAATAIISVVSLGPGLGPGRQVRLAVFAGTGVLISALLESLHAARRRARAHADTLGAVLGASEDPILVLDGRGRYLRVSRGAALALGQSPEAMRGRTWRELGQPEALMAPLEAARAEAVASGVSTRGEVAVDRPGGPPRSFEYVVTPVPGPRAGAVIVVARDITDRKRMEEALRLADRRKDEFLAMLAHELRNPLSAIGNAAQVAEMDDDPAQRVWALGVIAGQVAHLSRLIEDLLDVSRIARGKVRLRPRPVDLASVLDAAVEVARPLIQERRHRLVIEHADGPLWVRGDATRLKQVAANLLVNAAKYTEPGGEIRLASAREGADAVFRVRDTGVGIEPESLPRMFELFAQGDRAPGRSDGGLGIGLTLVKTLAELHGGSVEATSEGAGRGSEFTVRLPAIEPPDGAIGASRGVNLAPRPGQIAADEREEPARGARA